MVTPSGDFIPNDKAGKMCILATSPAEAFRNWVLPEFEMRLAMLRTQTEKATPLPA